MSVTKLIFIFFIFFIVTLYPWTGIADTPKKVFFFRKDADMVNLSGLRRLFSIFDFKRSYQCHRNSHIWQSPRIYSFVAS